MWPDEHAIVGSRLRLTWMTTHFSVLPPAAEPLAITFFTRAYILRLIGGVLFPNHSQSLVSLVYLEFLRDLQQCGAYSWGSATLAFLYRMLCRATRPSTREIGGALVILQVWAWEHIPCIRPTRTRDYHPGTGVLTVGEVVYPGRPWAARWSSPFLLDHTPTHVVTIYRDQFDTLTDDDVSYLHLKFCYFS